MSSRNLIKAMNSVATSMRTDQKLLGKAKAQAKQTVTIPASQRHGAGSPTRFGPMTPETYKGVQEAAQKRLSVRVKAWSHLTGAARRLSAEARRRLK